MRKRKGSAAVLLCVLLFSVTAMICTVYEAAERKTAISIAESSFEIAGRSVLACYDKELLSRYGLFGYELRGEKIGNMLRKMASDSLETAVIGTCSVRSVSVEEGAFSLGNPDIFLRQIRDAAKHEAVPELISFAREQLDRTGRNLEREEQASRRMQETEKNALQRAQEKEAAEREAAEANPESPGTVTHYTEDYRKVKRNLKRSETISRREPEESGGRVLANGKTAGSLPSVAAGMSGNAAFSGGRRISDRSGGIGGIADDAALLTYMHAHFNNKIQEEAAGEHFFRGETEYILYGSLSDDKNCRKTYQALFAMREAANIAYLYSDAAKRSETLGAAETLAPGPMAPAVQLLIISAWAAMEANNDMQNLEHGNGVPMVKTAETWMTDLDAVLHARQGGYLEIPGGSSMNYEKYLDVLLLTVDRKTKMFRVMDLIQINMKGTVRENFILADHFTGFSFKAEISKKSHARSLPSSSAVITMTHVYRTEDRT